MAAVTALPAGGASAAPTNGSAPTISGGVIGFDGRIGTDPSPTLTVSTGSWSQTGTDPLGYDYQWQSCSYPNAVLADGPTAYYRLGEPSGSTQLSDSSGLAQQAASMSPSGTLGATGAIAGDGDTAESFPLVPFVQGVLYRMTPGDRFTPSDFPTGTSPASIEAWIDPSGTPHDNGDIAGFGTGSADDSLNLQIHNTGSVVRLAAFDGARQYVATSGSIVAGSWYHVVLTYDGADIRLYQNGTLVGTFAEQSTFSLNPQYGAIDENAGGDVAFEHFGGSIDDVAFYSSALDATTISNHHTAGISAASSLRCADIPGATGPSFTVTPDLSGTSIRGQVTGWDETGSTTAWTAEDPMEGSVVIQPTADLTQAPAYGPTIVAGTVTDASGNPVVGARLSLYASVPTYTKVFPPLLAETFSDGNGNFELQLQDTGLTDSILNNSGGWINLTLMARTAGVETTDLLTRQYDPTQGSWTDQSGTVQSGAWLDDQGNSPSLETISLTTAGVLGGVSRVSNFNGGPCPPQIPQLVATTTGWANLGELHTWTTESGTFSYSKGSSTQISIAVAPNLSGPWTLSGSASLSRGSEYWQTWPGAGSSFAKMAQAGEQAGKYKYPKTACASQSYRVQPMKFLGGTNWAAVSGLSTPDGHCPDKLSSNSTLMLAGSRWGRSNGQGHSYSGGLSVFGIGLTTTSNWTSSTTESWSTAGTGAPAGHYLAVCGDGTGGTWQSAQRIYMGAWYSS